MGPDTPATTRTESEKSFLVLFFKKELSPYCTTSGPFTTIAKSSGRIYFANAARTCSDVAS